MSERQSPEPRAGYRHFLPMPTRWMDNDVYGHVNNVHFYSYFDTVVNRYLMDAGALDPGAGAVIGLVVETRCNYFESVSFPECLDAGLRVARIGNSSVRYEIALFRAGAAQAAAQGHFVHVYVDRTSRRPVALPPALRAALDKIAV
jgi:acyl-CoA thioester hydrolase